jgi:superfamily II DNA or RNA helicase
VNFDSLLARADDETLQILLGQSAVRLITALDRSLATPTNLRNVLLRLHPREELLLAPQTRGSLFDLLRPDEAKLLAEMLGVSDNGDVYGSLKALRATRGSERERILFGFFELRPPVIEPPETVPTSRECAPEYSLFPHQRKAAREVVVALSCEPRRILLHMPTGSGKTRTAMNVVADHLRGHEPALVIWLAYSEELCEQAASEFERAWQPLGNRPLPVHRFWGDHSLSLDGVRDGLVVAGLAKLYSAGKSSLEFLATLGSRSSLIVMDEAHQAIAATYRHTLDALFVTASKSALLGLSATPGRTWSDIDTDRQLANYFAGHKVTLALEGYENPVEYLTDAGYLARAEFRPLLHQGGIELTTADLARLQDSFDVPDSILRRLAEDESRNLAILLELKGMVERHRRIITFAATVEHSWLLACTLSSQGVKAYSVTGDTPANERARLIADFKDDAREPKVLCNYGVLTTGFDAPQTSAALIARPTKSLVLYSQMVGRAIRGVKAGGNADAEIVTVVDKELPGFGAVAEAFTNWEDVWTKP